MSCGSRGNVLNIFVDADERENLIYELSRIHSSKLPVSKWYPSVEMFFRLLDTLPAGTSQCERYFSLLNFYKSNRRSKLKINRFGEMIIESFRQESSLYVDAWLKLGKYHASIGKDDEESDASIEQEHTDRASIYQTRLAAIPASQRYKKVQWSRK
jgi:hypothetical protein